MSAVGQVLEKVVGEAIPGLELPKEACKEKSKVRVGSHLPGRSKVHPPKTDPFPCRPPFLHSLPASAPAFRPAGPSIPFTLSYLASSLACCLPAALLFSSSSASKRPRCSRARPSWRSLSLRPQPGGT